jgi:hypothetical protein
VNDTDLLLGDACSFCGRKPAGGVDVIEDEDRRGTSADNLTAACDDCHDERGDEPVLHFMLRRRVA